MDDMLLEQLEDMGAEAEKTVKRLMGDRALYIQYLMRLPEDPNLPALKSAVEKRDSAAAMHAVHTLKGVALNLGLLPLSDVCMDMLLDFREGNPDKAFDQMDTVESVFNEWVGIIREATKSN